MWCLKQQGNKLGWLGSRLGDYYIGIIIMLLWHCECIHESEWSCGLTYLYTYSACCVVGMENISYHARFRVSLRILLKLFCHVPRVYRGNLLFFIVLVLSTVYMHYTKSLEVSCKLTLTEWTMIVHLQLLLTFSCIIIQSYKMRVLTSKLEGVWGTIYPLGLKLQ